MTPLGSGNQINEHQNILTMDTNVKISDAAGVPSLYIKQEGMTGKVYKLTIQVNKLRVPPGPKSKKMAMVIASRRKLRSMTNPILSTKFPPGVRAFVPTVAPTPAPAVPATVAAAVPPAPVARATPPIPRSHPPFKKHSTPAFTPLLNKTIKCTACPEYFDSQRSMYMHRKVHNICGYCDTPCETRTQCLYHEKLHIGTDPVNPFKCHICSKAFDKKKGLKDHVKMFHTVQNVEDGESFTYVEKEEMDKSLLTKEYPCEICKMVLYDADSYSNHMKIHENSMDQEPQSPEEERECNVCKKTFQSEESLSLHLSHHLSRAHHCNVCRKAFINRTTLAVHMKTHKNLK